MSASLYELFDRPLPSQMCGTVLYEGPGGHNWMCIGDEHPDTPDKHTYVPTR